MLTKRNGQHYFVQFYHEWKARRKEKYVVTGVWEDADSSQFYSKVQFYFYYSTVSVERQLILGLILKLDGVKVRHILFSVFLV